jgi:hypothetical protein
MTEALSTRKRARACRIDKTTGQRNCAALQVDQPACPHGVCCGKAQALVGQDILRQREALTRHLRPRLEPVACKRNAETGCFDCRGRDPRWCFETNACARVWSPAKMGYRATRPRRCRTKCRAAVPCPPGHCFASVSTVSSEVRLHEYAGIHGAEKGAGNYWELAVLELTGERPHPVRLLERDVMATELSKSRSPSSC